MAEDTVEFWSPNQGAGIFLASWLGMAGALTLLIVAAWRGQPFLAGLSAALLAVGLLARLWSRLSLVNLRLERSLSTSHAFPGDRVILTHRLANNKLLPLSWVETAELVPSCLLADPDAPPASETAPGSAWLSGFASLAHYQWVKWDHQLICRRRGYYSMGPALVSSGDVFGLFRRMRTDREPNHLIVYPRIYPLRQLGLPSRFPLGDSRADSRIFEDPSRTIGLRGYTSGTPFKHIHWKASARRQQLQVKVFEPTTTLQVAIFLDADGFLARREKAPDDELFESGISTAASLARHIVESSQPAGLYVNALQAGLERPVAVRPRSGGGHLAAMLEGLARLEYRSWGGFGGFIDHFISDVFQGSTVALITCDLNREVEQRLAALKMHGYKVMAFLLGGEPAPASRVPVIRIHDPAEMAEMTGRPGQ